MTGNALRNYEDEGKTYTRQTPQPEVTTPSGANYMLWGDATENYGMWHYYAEYTIDTAYYPVEGTMIGGQSYVADIWLKADEGYNFAPNCTVKINGGTLMWEDISGWEGGEMFIKVDAVHNQFGHANTSGYLKAGQDYDYCTVCGTPQNVKYSPASYVKSMKLKKGRKSFTVKWKKQNKKNLKKFSGYQIRYSTSSDMRGAKYVKASKKSKSKKIGKLAKKTKYYVQMRSYTGGYYSGWSAVKSVKTK